MSILQARSTGRLTVPPVYLIQRYARVSRENTAVIARTNGLNSSCLCYNSHLTPTANFLYAAPAVPDPGHNHVAVSLYPTQKTQLTHKPSLCFININHTVFLTVMAHPSLIQEADPESTTTQLLSLYLLSLLLRALLVSAPCYLHHPHPPAQQPTRDLRIPISSTPSKRLYNWTTSYITPIRSIQIPLSFARQLEGKPKRILLHHHVSHTSMELSQQVRCGCQHTPSCANRQDRIYIYIY